MFVEKGNGIYKGFDKDFSYISDQGKVKNEKKDSVWQGRVSFSHADNVRFNDGKSMLI